MDYEKIYIALSTASAMLAVMLIFYNFDKDGKKLPKRVILESILCAVNIGIIPIKIALGRGFSIPLVLAVCYLILAVTGAYELGKKKA